MMAIAVGICATGATFGIVMTIFSFCNTFAELPNTLSPFFAYRKYPKCCVNSPVKMNAVLVFAVMTFLVCAYLCIQMALTLDVKAIVGIFTVYVVGFIYFFIRVKYLRNKGIDILAEMRAPYEPWEEKERSYNS